MRRGTLLYGLIGAALLWAALPPLDLWPLAWIAPLPWLMLIRASELPGRRQYRSLWLAGFVFWLAALHWLRLAHWTAYFGWVALAFYLAFYLPAFIALTRGAVHRLHVPVILAAPVVWTGLELVRGHLLSGFSMADLGHTQYRWIGLIQLSDLTGAYGVSFVVMLVAACLARMLPCEGKSRAIWPLLPAVAVVGAAMLYGHARTAPVGPKTSTPLRVALIQGSIDTEMKFDPKQGADTFRHYFELSDQAIRKYGKVDLIVWPETMFRQPLVIYDEHAQKPAELQGTDEQFRQWLKESDEEGRHAIALTAEAIGVPLLLGVDIREFGADGFRLFNSAVYVAKSGELLGRYDKMHPVVFGEYIPFSTYVPFLQRLLPWNLTAGAAPSVFTINGVRLAPNICYETVLPHLIRRQVNTLKAQGAEPDALMNLTNDGWFWGSSELDMHLACGVFRAVECRKPLLIAANTGFSAWIDADGTIVQQGPRRASGTILAEVRADDRYSWYLEHGDWAAGCCLAASVAFGVGGIVVGRGR